MCSLMGLGKNWKGEMLWVADGDLGEEFSGVDCLYVTLS